MHPGDLLGIREQTASGVGEKDLFADPVKQRLAQLCFKRLDLRGDAGLRIIQLLGGTRKAASFHHDQKREQVARFHLASPFAKRYHQFFEWI
ncbi:hypothetical protein D3C85_1462780 [compost metagenome]